MGIGRHSRQASSSADHRVNVEGVGAMRLRILVVDRTDSFHRDFAVELIRRGFEVIEASETLDVFSCLESRPPDVLAMFASLSTAPAILKLARKIRNSHDKLLLFFIARDSSEDLAIEVLRAGFNDYFKPPLSPTQLADTLERWIPGSAHEAESRLRTFQSPKGDSGAFMLGESQLIRHIRDSIPRISASDCNVLVTGETGTGKELVAELLHAGSTRNHKPLARINCAAIPDSLFESELFGYEKGAFTGAHASKSGRLKLADGGSVFLDEVGDLSLYTQAKMLRVLESKEIERLGGTRTVPLDIRVIAATNRDLEQMVANGQFRGDLFFRLDVVRVHLPPLRERKEDIPLLLDHFIGKLNAKFGCDVEGLSEETLDRLLQYDWPGNIRELKNLLESVFVMVSGGRIALTDLPPRFRERLKQGEHRTQSDRERILWALLSTDWNKSRAARKLHWSRMTLYRKMAKFGVDEDRAKQKTQVAQKIS